MLKRNQLVFFFILTFAITWMMWLPAALTKLSGGTSILGPDGVGQLGRWAPGIVAIILTGICRRQTRDWCLIPSAQDLARENWLLFVRITFPARIIFPRKMD